MFHDDSPNASPQEDSAARSTSVAVGRPDARFASPLSRQLFGVLVLFGLAPLLLSNIWGYWQTRSETIRGANEDVDDVASLQAAEAARWMDQQTRVLPSLIAGNQHLFALSRSIKTCASVEECDSVRAALRAHLGAKVEDTDALLQLQVISDLGEVLGSSEDYSQGRHDLLCLSTAGGGRAAPTLSYEHDGDPIMTVSARIRDTAGDHLGWLCGRFEFRVHEILVNTSAHRSLPTTSYLVDAGGQVVCSSLEHNEGAHVGQELDLHESSESEEQEHAEHEALVRVHRERASHWPMLSENPWSGRYRLASGVGVLAAYRPIPTADWGLVAEVPVSAALSNLNSLKWQAFAFGSVFSLLLLGVAMFAARRVARPLLQLAEAAGSAAGGRLGETVPLRGPKEVRDLGLAFNRMSVALRESHRDLERRIATRTAALERSTEFLRTLLNTIEQRVIVVDRSGQVLSVNKVAERLHGERLSGRAFFEVTQPAEGSRSEHPLSRCLETGNPAGGDVSELLGNGREIVHLDAYPITTGQGEVESVVTVGRIVTDERRLQAQLVHQEKMASFGLLAAGMAHDIANPLASIESQLRLAREIPNEQRTQETLEIVEREVARISRLLRELVSFARRRVEDAAWVDPKQVVEDTLRLLAHDPRAAGIEVSIHVDGELPPLKVAEDGLVQVLLNLGVNALQAMSPPGTLRFELKREGDDLTIRVEDSGPGFASESLRHLFEPFFTTKPPGTGTGLGLFVSRGIIQSMSGTLSLASSGPEGTVFELRVPYAQASQGADA